MARTGEAVVAEWGNSSFGREGARLERAVVSGGRHPVAVLTDGTAGQLVDRERRGDPRQGR